MTEDRAFRVGLMIPSSNTMMEVDFCNGLPPGANLHTARMYMEDTTRAGESRMLDEFALGAARDLGTAHPDIVVFGCTSAGALRGNDYDEQLCAQIAEVTGASTVSTIASVRDAIRTSGARRIGIVTPYVDELNIAIKTSIEADGFEVVRIAGMGISDNFQIALVTVEEIVDFAESVIAHIDVDLVFASCTNMAGIAARAAIAHRLGLPVITSNQAVLDATVDRLLSMATAP